MDSSQEHSRRRPQLKTLLLSAASRLSPPEPILSAIKPPTSRQAWLRFLFTRLPILHWIWTYQYTFLVPDIVSGITVAVMHIPQGLAYGLLTTLDPVYGLYTSLVPVVVYSIFGTSKHISIGVFAIICLMVRNGIEQALAVEGFGTTCILDNAKLITINNTTNITCGALKAQIAVSLAFSSGLIMVLMGLFQLGFISIFLSEPLISGYTTGSAIHVFTSQIPYIFGIGIDIKPYVPVLHELLTVPRVWIDAFRQIFITNSVNVAAFLIALCSIMLMVSIELINSELISRIKCWCCLFSRRHGKCHRSRMFKWPFKIPGPLIVIIIATAMSATLNFKKRFHITVAGTIPTNLPPLSLPTGHYVLITLPSAFTISIVTYAIGISLAQAFAKQYKYKIDSNQELIAYGLCNLVGSFFSSFNSSISLSRSLVQASAGGKTQLIGIISAVVMALLVVFGGFLLEPLPDAVLGAIIWVAIYAILKQVKDLWMYMKLSLSDTAVWVFVFWATVLLGVDLGLLCGVLFSLFIIILKLILPQSFTSEHCTESSSSESVSEKNAEVLVFNFQAPICFVNSAVFRRRLEIATEIDKRQRDGDKEKGCLELCSSKIIEHSRLGKSKHLESSGSGAIDQRSSASYINTVIIDCSCIAFLDSVGVKMLSQIVSEFDEANVQVILSAVSAKNRAMLQKAQFFAVCGEEWIFENTEEALQHARHGSRLHPYVSSLKAIRSEKSCNQKQVLEGTELNAAVIQASDTTDKGQLDISKDDN
ncbi:hypothetical protein EMCRGX_G026427 [Ephydatia muelleri]|eukprot:Em0014g617a